MPTRSEMIERKKGAKENGKKKNKSNKKEI